MKTATDPKTGLGLVTTKDIPSDKVITRFDGEKVNGKADPTNRYKLQIRPKVFIDGSKTNVEGLGRWIKPAIRKPANAEFVVQNMKPYVYATKYIHAGSEILAKHKIEVPKPPKPPKRKSRLIRPVRERVNNEEAEAELKKVFDELGEPVPILIKDNKAVYKAQLRRLLKESKERLADKPKVIRIKKALINYRPIQAPPVPAHIRLPPPRRVIPKKKNLPPVVARPRPLAPMRGRGHKLFFD